METANPRPRPDQREAIRHRAEELYIRNGRLPGRDLENWAQAEREILRESAEPSVRPHRHHRQSQRHRILRRVHRGIV